MPRFARGFKRPRAAAPSTPEPPTRLPFLPGLVFSCALCVLLGLAFTRSSNEAPLLRSVESRFSTLHTLDSSASVPDTAAPSLATPLSVLPARAAAAASAPAATAASAASASAAAPAVPYRGVLDPSQAVRALHFVTDWQDGATRLQHAVPSQRCPKWLQVEQNREAGAGHRLRQWSTALWVAASLPATSHVAFAHTSLEVGAGKHGGYPGLDAFLGLRQGEAALDAPGLLSPAGKGVREFPCSLDWVTEAPYAPNAAMLGKWERRMGNPDDCNFLYTAPKDHWSSDHSSSTRLIHAWKFAAAAKARARAGQRLALPGPPAEWDPAAVHIGLHQRMNDGLLVPEEALARIVSRYVLAELAAADVRARIVLHVFAETQDAARELPALSALGGQDLGPGRGALAVHFHGEEVDFVHTVWSLSQCDVFVGSVSSMSCECGGGGEAVHAHKSAAQHLHSAHTHTHTLPTICRDCGAILLAPCLAAAELGQGRGL